VVDESANELTSLDAATDRSTGTTPMRASSRFVLGAPDGAHLYVVNIDAGTLTVLGSAS
jgi:hypothetical protein